jgi:hypothetical protein
MSQVNTDQEIKAFIDSAFEDNYLALRVEVGRGLSTSGRLQALRQVRLYWRKLHAVAEAVTDTEVKLTLPDCKSPAGRPFAVEGVVDLVREGGSTTMYDIKAHDPDYVRDHTDEYQAQLNVYAHIWQELRRQRLDETAIIATVFPPAIRRALDAGDERALEIELGHWEPLVPLGFDLSRVDDTILALGAMVDSIEEGRFTPRTPEDLAEARSSQRRRTFATDVCRNCDARFSCASYRQWALGAGPNMDDFRAYFSDLEDRDVETYRADALTNAPDPDDLAMDLEV